MITFSKVNKSSRYLFGMCRGMVFTRLHRLKSTRSREKKLKELLYYSQVNEIHEAPCVNESLPPAIKKIQLNRDAFIIELKRAIERNEFALHYQPMVDVITGKMTHVETLIRWQHPVHGLLNPELFLSLCENTGMIIPLNEWTIKHACQQLKIWHEAGFSSLCIFINLSTLQLNDPSLLPLIKQSLSENNLPPESLTLEITENSLMKNIQKSMRIIQALSDLGVKLSLDDFGTGYSSLQYLKQIPVSYLKIDKLFIKELSTSITSFGIVESIILLGKNLGLTIVAEGVENKNQLNILKKMGCHEVQGYLYGKPIPANEFAELLQSEERNETPREKIQYQYEVLTNKHYDQVANLITQSFCEQDAMTKYLDVKPAEWFSLIKKVIDKAIPEGMSVVTLDHDNVIACTIVDDIAHPFHSTTEASPKLQILFSFQDALTSDFFNERAMYKGHIARLFMTAVNKNYRGLELSKKINVESARLAKEKNFDFMCSTFNNDDNEKTINHLRNSKLLIRSCKYADFVLSDRKPFETLEGNANAYIWELRKGAKLRYRIK